MNIFENLREDHDYQRSLINTLVDTQGDTKTREKTFTELKHAMANHADAEERYFYRPLLNDDVAQKHARHSIAEHHELDELVSALEEIDMSSPQWLTTCKKLQHELLHHLKEEEREIFPVAGKVLKPSKKESLAEYYVTLMRKRES